MESVNLYYCFRPTCSHSQSRVCTLDSVRQLHSDCAPWVLSEDYLQGLGSKQTVFSADRLIPFSSQPLQAQVYLQTHQESILNVLMEQAYKLRTALYSEIAELDQYVCQTLDTMFMGRDYNEFRFLAAEKGVSPYMKSIRLTQLLDNQHLPEWKDTPLLTNQAIEETIAGIRTCVKHLFNFQIPQKTGDEMCPQIMIPIDQKQNKSGQQERQVALERREEEQRQELWKYIQSNCNLKTAQLLVGSVHTRFFFPQGQKEARVHCCWCDFEVRIRTRSKLQTNSACAYAIMEHLLSRHPISSLNTFRLKTDQFISLTLQQLLEQISRHPGKDIVAIQSFGLSSKKRVPLSEGVFAIQFVRRGQKPQFHPRHLTQGNNSKQMLILVGVLLDRVSFLNKQLTVYTPQSTCDVFNQFISSHQLSNLTLCPTETLPVLPTGGLQ